MKTLFSFLLLAGFTLLPFAQTDCQSTLKKQATQLLRESEQAFSRQEFKLARDKAREAHDIAQNIGDPILAARSLTIGAKATYAAPGLLSRRKAEKMLEESLQLLRNYDQPELEVANLKLLKHYAELKGDPERAFFYAREISRITGKEIDFAPPPPSDNPIFRNRRKAARDIANRLDSLRSKANESALLKAEQETLNQQLAESESRINAMSEAQMRQELILSEQERMLDSLHFATLLDSLEMQAQKDRLRNQENELREQKAKLELQKSQRNFFLALAALILLLGLGGLVRFLDIRRHNRVLEEKNRIIQEEKQRSESLLLNILPAAVAEELKQEGKANTRYYEQATVLFTDFKDFTRIAEQLTPRELVEELDHCFRNFDAIISRHGLEKIKTIGDAYMCAGGLPEPDKAHPMSIVRAALDIQDFLMEWKLEKVAQGKPWFEARVGVHTGPIIAGVVGLKKFAYDIWGDTVNIAARMESSSDPGQVNISANTYELIKKDFEVTYRGKIPVKNKGDIDMYYVRRARTSV